MFDVIHHICHVIHHMCDMMHRMCDVIHHTCDVMHLMCDVIHHIHAMNHITHVKVLNELHVCVSQYHTPYHSRHLRRNQTRTTTQEYGVATVSRIDKMIGLFCKRAL